MGRDVLPPNESALLRDALRRIAQLEQRLGRGSQPVGREIDVPFSYPGVLVAATSPIWRPRWKVRLTEWVGTLTTAPTSTTTVQLIIDGGGHQSLIFAAGETLDVVGLDHSVGPENSVQVAITVVGGSPAGLDAQIGGYIVNAG